MEKEYTFSFLQAQHMPVLLQTFLKAFADYLLPIQLSKEQFEAKLKREGILPSFCVAAYEGNEMVGFILTGLGEWNGKPTAYNAGTGVVPQHRGLQLTERLYHFLIPKLRESGVTQCLLEVIEENKPALNVYKGVGFKIVRSVNSYRSPKKELLLDVPSPPAITITPALKPDWAAYVHFNNYEPTWQNSATAYKHYPGEKKVLEARTITGEVVGYIALLVENGAVLQLAVQPDFRRQGIASALLREGVTATKSITMMFINVDTKATDFIEFLHRRHFSLFLRQYEMLLQIG